MLIIIANQNQFFFDKLLFSLERVSFSFFARRHVRIVTQGTHTHTHIRILATLRTRSTRTPARSHVPGNFAITARSMRRRRSVNPAGEGGGAGEAWFHRVEQLETHGKRDDTFRGVHRLHGNARAAERAPGKPCGMSADITSLELNGTRLSPVIETSFDSSCSRVEGLLRGWMTNGIEWLLWLRGDFCLVKIKYFMWILFF